jgi:hypothetical protein
MPVHAVHIFQMPPSSLVSVKGPLRRESVKVFDGYSLTDFDERIGVEFSRSGLSIRFIEQSSKFGLPPETLLATHESAALELHPCADLSGPLPDQGFVTQVWTGDVTLPFVEIEQLSAIRRESVGEAAAIRLCPRTRA